LVGGVLSILGIKFILSLPGKGNLIGFPDQRNLPGNFPPGFSFYQLVAMSTVLPSFGSREILRIVSVERFAI
jgi:hypothetical protein